MRTVSENLETTLTGSRQVHATLAAYYDGEPVLDEVPISAGSLSIDDGQQVAGILSTEVPRYVTTDDGSTVDLLPTAENAPITAEGSQFAVTYYVSQPGRVREAIGLGWYRVQDWSEGPGTVTFTSASLEALVQEARFLFPKVVAAGTAFAVAAEQLLGGLLPLEVTAASGLVTGGQTFEEDRLDALHKLANAWPARLYVDDSGTLVVAPPLSDATDPVVAQLADGEGGTVVELPKSGTRDGGYNAVKASGEASGNVAPVSAVAYLRERPRQWNGPYGNVPYFYSSPLLTTKAQARRAAQTRLERLQRTAAPVTITAAPDPRFEVGDLIEVTYRGATLLVRIDSVQFPLTASEGVMVLGGHEVVR